MRKSLYVANIFFILSLCFAKLSIAVIARSLKPLALNNQLCLGVGALTILWAIVSLSVAAFQCHVPETWNFLSNSCINRTSFWAFVNIFSILLDMPLIVVPISVVYDLQTKLNHKMLIIGVFSSRLL